MRARGSRSESKVDRGFPSSIICLAPQRLSTDRVALLVISGTNSLLLNKLQGVTSQT